MKYSYNTARNELWHLFWQNLIDASDFIVQEEILWKMCIEDEE